MSGVYAQLRADPRADVTALFGAPAHEHRAPLVVRQTVPCAVFRVTARALTVADLTRRDRQNRLIAQQTAAK